MSSPEHTDKPTATPLDAEREQLRKAGYTESEISQILIARASQQSAGAAGQGVMSNVLSSLVAVGSFARGVVPSFKKDAATIFDNTATASARTRATASLAVKAVVVLVLSYAAWQEWQQHIIYATQQAASDAYLKCKRQGGCAGVPTGFEAQPISPDEIERERAELAALYGRARSIALRSPIVRAPDGRMVHEIGLVPEDDFKQTPMRREGQLPNTPSIDTDAGRQLYKLAPDWWLADEAAPPSPR